MVGELVNVLELPVEIRGGAPSPRRTFRGPVGEEYTARGGFWLQLSAFEAGGEVTLRPVGPDRTTTVRAFADPAAARVEYARLAALLWAREWVGWAADRLTRAGVLPAEFLPTVLSGDGESLLAAADWRDERDAPDAALLLRAAYHRINGTANVVVPAGKGRSIVLNPHEVTKRNPPRPETGGLRAAVIEEGRAIRIVSLEDRERRERVGGQHRWVSRCEVAERSFAVGDQAEYDSYNLVYYGPIRSITARTVTIDGAWKGTKRLTIARFVAKNCDFDLAAAQERNANWSD